MMNMEGGLRMKQGKRTIWTYGTVLRPVELGKPAIYYNNGVLKRTSLVESIMENKADHVTFETSGFIYCIEYQRADVNVMGAAA